MDGMLVRDDRVTRLAAREVERADGRPNLRVGRIEANRMGDRVIRAGELHVVEHALAE